MDMASKISNRKNSRVVCGAPARAEGPRGPVRGQCRTLSRMGMFFQGGQFPVGQSIELSVELPAGQFQATGEVRSHHAYEDGAGMGIRFTRLAQEDLSVIQKFLEQHV